MGRVHRISPATSGGVGGRPKMRQLSHYGTLVPRKGTVLSRWWTCPGWKWDKVSWHGICCVARNRTLSWHTKCCVSGIGTVSGSETLLSHNKTLLPSNETTMSRDGTRVHKKDKSISRAKLKLLGTGFALMKIAARRGNKTKTKQIKTKRKVTYAKNHK